MWMDCKGMHMPCATTRTCGSVLGAASGFENITGARPSFETDPLAIRGKAAGLRVR